MTPNGNSRLDRIEAILDRLAANSTKHDDALKQLAENAERQQKALDQNAERQQRALDHLSEIANDLTGKSLQHDREIERLIEHANKHNEALDRITSVLDRLADNAIVLQEAQERYEEELKRGAEVHRELEEKLNALIQIVDETIRKKPRNGDQSIQ